MSLDDFLNCLNDKIIIKDLNDNIIYSNFDFDKIDFIDNKHIIYNKKIYSFERNIFEDYIIEIFHDVTYYVLKINELKKDCLTGLYNRHAIYEKLNKIDDKYCIAIGDVDFFKNINDTYGHLVGDEILRKLSKILLDNFDDEIIGRFGGEEFIIIFSCNIDEAYNKLENVRKKISQTDFNINKISINISMTFGLSESNNLNFNKVLNEADKYLYLGKNNGRNQTNYKKRS